MQQLSVNIQSEKKLGISETLHLHSPWECVIIIIIIISLNIHAVKTHTTQAQQLKLSMSRDFCVFDAQTIKSAYYMHR